MEGFGAFLAKAHEETVQEYKTNFKETNDYLDLLDNASKEYKASLKKVNPDFDAEYYDRLILKLEEPQTPAPEDLVGFDQLDHIRTPDNVQKSHPPKPPSRQLTNLLTSLLCDLLSFIFYNLRTVPPCAGAFL